MAAMGVSGARRKVAGWLDGHGQWYGPHDESRIA